MKKVRNSYNNNQKVTDKFSKYYLYFVNAIWITLFLKTMYRRVSTYPLVCFQDFSCHLCH